MLITEVSINDQAPKKMQPKVTITNLNIAISSFKKDQNVFGYIKVLTRFLELINYCNPSSELFRY